MVGGVLWNPLSFLLKDSIQSNSQTSKESSFGRYQLVKNSSGKVPQKQKRKRRKSDEIVEKKIAEEVITEKAIPEKAIPEQVIPERRYQKSLYRKRVY